MKLPPPEWIDSPATLADALLPPRGRLFIVADRRVVQLYSLPFSSSNTLFVDGEETVVKRVGFVVKVWRWLSHRAAQRSDTLAVVGGGSLLDACSFAASTYKRGMALTLVPTTLLAMVDAAIGGKTAINFRHTKNLIGTFYTPQRVLLCPAFLATLTTHQLLEGWAEVLKHALIASKELWHKCKQTNPTHLTAWECSLLTANYRIKAAIVEQDFHDHHGRHLLNFAHTFAHALESQSLQNKKVPHGLAVAAGILAEAYISHRTASLHHKDLAEITHTVLTQFAGVLPPPPEESSFLQALHQDKKAHASALRLPLLTGIGRAEVFEVNNYREVFAEALHYYRSLLTF